MNESEFDDETLMAFADGELDEASAAVVEEAIKRDDELMSRVAMFMETRARAKAEMAPLLDQPAPAGLEQAVRAMVEESRKAPATGVEVAAEPAASIEAARYKRRAGGGGGWVLPLAASLATAAAAGLIGYQLGNTGTSEPLQIAAMTDKHVVQALQSLASGDERQLAGGRGRIRIVSSFRDQDGTFCREYEIDPEEGPSLVAVSCREAEEWATRFAVVAPVGGDGYAPASSMEALEAYLSAIGASAALSQAEEAEALDEMR